MSFSENKTNDIERCRGGREDGIRVHGKGGEASQIQPPRRGAGQFKSSLPGVRLGFLLSNAEYLLPLKLGKQRLSGQEFLSFLTLSLLFPSGFTRAGRTFGTHLLKLVHQALIFSMAYLILPLLGWTFRLLFSF